MPVINIVSPETRALQTITPHKPAAPGFTDQFMEMLKDVNTEMYKAEEAKRAFAAGENNNIHETILAAERASIAFKLVGSIRAKMIEAYQDVMRMGI